MDQCQSLPEVKGTFTVDPAMTTIAMQSRPDMESREKMNASRDGLPNYHIDM
jgi:hypothetical protein